MAGKTYEFLLSIAGKVTSSLPASTTAASRSLQDLQRNAQTATQGLNSVSGTSTRMAGLKTSLAGLATAFGAVGVMAAGYLKGAIDGAIKAQEANSNVEATIKSTGMAAGMTAKEVLDMAAAFSKTTLFSSSAIKTGDAMLLTFTNIGKDVLPLATDAMLNMATKMKTDPVQSAIQLGKALNDPTKGLTALTRVGVTFSAEQKKQIEAMQKAGNVAGAQKVILAELSKEFGGQATAATKTYAGQMEMLSKTMSGIKTSIGMVMLPYLQKVMEKFQGVATIISDFASKNTKLVAGILTLTAVFGTLIGGAGLVQKILGVLGPVAGGLGTTIGGMMLPVVAVIAGIALLGMAYSKNFGGMKTAVDGFVNGSMKFLIQVFNQAKTWFITNLPAIKATFKAVFNDVVAVFKGVIAFLEPIFMPVFRNVHQWFVTNLPGIKAAFETAFNKVVEVATVLWSYFQANLLPIIMRLVNTIRANLPAIQEIFSNVFAIVGNVLGIAWEVIKKVWDVIVGLYDFISPTFPAIGAIIKTAFDIVIGVVEAVVGTFIKLVDWITKAVKWLTTWNGSEAKEKTVKVSKWTDENSAYTKAYGIGSNQKIGGNAAGTDNWRGGLTFVGERGPELLNLPRGSQITPNHTLADLAKGGSTGGNSQPSITFSPVVTVNAGSDADTGKIDEIVRQALRDAQGEFVKLIENHQSGQRRVSYGV